MRKLLVVLLVLVMVGYVVRVPSARASYPAVSFGGPSYGNVMDYNHSLVGFVALGAPGVAWTGYYQVYAGWGALQGNLMAGYTVSFSIDGVPASEPVMDAYGWPTCDNVRIRFQPVAGTHSYEWYIHGWYGTGDQSNRQEVTWVGSVSGYDSTVYGEGGSGGSGAGPGVYPVGGPPLAASVTGPSSVSVKAGGTWTGSATGGTAPYTYAWDYGAIGPFFFYDKGSGASFDRVLPVGTWTVSCRVTDSVGDTAFDDLVVVSSEVVGGYRIELTRSGAYGQYIAGRAYTADGRAIGITGASGTQCGLYADLGGSDKSFGWYDNSNGSTGAGQYDWTLSVTIGEATVIPPADFWFKSDVTVYDPVLAQSIVCHVSHHFGNIAEIADAYYSSEGDPVQPEVPPEEQSSLPAWVKAILDALYIMFAPLILVFEVIKMLISWVVGLLGYLGGAITMVVSFGILLIRWASVAVASVVSFGSATPGGYVSLSGLFTLAGVAVPGGSSVFSAIDITAASVDVPLEALHTWIMAVSHQWLWWGVFTYGILAWVMQLGHGGEEE